MNPIFREDFGSAKQRADGKDLNDNYSFDLVFDSDFTKMSSVNPNSKTSLGLIPGVDVKNNVTEDAWYVEDLTDGSAFGGLHRENHPSKQASRHLAFYDRHLADVVDQNTTDGLIQGGYVNESPSDGEKDVIHTEIYQDKDTNEDIDPREFNICTSFISTFGAEWSPALPNSPHGHIPSTKTPNVSFGNNTYFEVEVNFSKHKTAGFRHTAWLMPATFADGRTNPVIFGDNDIDNNGNGIDRYVKEQYGNYNPANGVEIDIYEHENTPLDANGNDRSKTLSMKCLANAGNGNLHTFNA